MKNRKYVILGLVILFIVLSILVMTEYILGFDELAYKLITFNMNDMNTTIYKGITFLGSTKFMVLLCVFFLVLFIILKKKNVGIIISIVLIISTIVNNLLKIIFCRERPDVLKLVVEDSYSFPSGHTMAAVSMYGILIYIVLKSDLNKILKRVLVVILGIIPFLVALSRVYLGAHFASDVVASFLVSITLLLIEIYVIDKKNWL